jgi:peptidoglycan glycosyltransferase
MNDQFAPVMNKCGVGTAAAPLAPPLDLEPGAAGSIGPATGEPQARFALAGIGQGDVFATPLEMALVGAGIANGGVIMEPHVGKEITDSDGHVVDEIAAKPWLVCTSPQTAAAVTDMMVLNVEQGTATGAQIPGVTVAAKTGTAQNEVGDPHAWFVAFAPAENPRFAVSVLVENGGSFGSEATGGRVAAPIARQVLETLLAQ